MSRLALLVVLVCAVGCHGGKGAEATCTAESSAGGEAQATDTTVEQDIHELLRITHATQLAQQMLGPLLDTLAKAYPQVPAAFWQEMAKATSGDEFETLIVDVYKQHLSHEDIRALLAFNRSPAGQRVIAKMPTIMQASQLAGQAWGARIAEGFLREAKNRGYQL